MPELPEVETIRRDLESKVLNLSIVNVKVHDPRILRTTKKSHFIKTCQGKTIQSVSRRGKAIIFQFLSQGYLIVQPMMTGQLIFVADQKDNATDKHTKVTFILSNGGCLNYNDQRLFGRLTLVEDLSKIKFLQTIGPEPLEKAFNPQFIAKITKARKAPIKSLLMNQQLVAGIGNIYASEILFASHINPKRSARSLKQHEIELLHKSTVAILEEAIDHRGTSMRNYRDAAGEKGNFINRIKVYGREKETCTVCRTPIMKIVQAGRSTFYCRKCQK